MDQIAFVFAGQGAQYPGMGRSLYERNAASAAVLDRLEQLRPGTLDQCFSAKPEDLARTDITQPCMFAVELAAAAALQAIPCQCAAGFSLGEIAALTYTGAVTLEDGFHLVCRRGELMHQAASQSDCGMGAVVKLEDATVEYLCAGYEHIYPVNYNCPGQVAVAGTREELKLLADDVKQAGGRLIPLKVSGGFHSPYMTAAAVGFSQVLQDAALREPRVQLYSDYTARPYAGDYRDLLTRQICSPVRWKQIIVHMREQGIDTVIELGPGKTLCGLIQKTDSTAKTLHVEDAESLAKTLEELQC